MHERFYWFLGSTAFVVAATELLRNDIPGAAVGFCVFVLLVWAGFRFGRSDG